MKTAVVILAEALAKMMARNTEQEPPEVEGYDDHAEFAIDTPFGRVRVDLTVIE